VALNRGFSYRSRVSPEAAGRTLLSHLILSYRHSDEATWQARLRAAEITLDGTRAAGTEVLAPGQAIVWARPPWDEPEVPLTFTVIHEDDDLLILDKPAGLPTLPAGGFLEHTLWTLARARWPGASPVHRLGRHTSGLVVLGRSPQASRAVSRAWREHRVVKEYLALGAGQPDWSSRDVTARIGPVPHPIIGEVFAVSPAGKAAHSAVSVHARRGGDTIFRVRITTGRPHQIRIHLAFAGHPLAGDPLYAAGGVPRSDAPGLPGDGGYRLHAQRVCLPHPASGEPLCVEAPPPSWLA
jgi:23S rRNA pseudouridine1911/1915/1917 synthase